MQATATTTHPAVAALLTAPADGVGVSMLSSVLEALRTRRVRAALTSSSSGGGAAAEREQQVMVCKELLRRLVAVANDSARGTAARVLCVECLYTLSCGASEAFCQGELFAAVQQLNASFDELLDNSSSSKSSSNDDDDDDDALAASRAMLTVLLFRCTGYTRLRAGDVLRQLCGNDERRLVRLLRMVLLRQHHASSNISSNGDDDDGVDAVEWPLRVAVMRCLYELTTPVGYFDADSDVSEVRADAFLSRMSTLREYLLHHPSRTLLDVLDDIAVQWQHNTTTRTSTSDTRGALHDLTEWSVLLRYVAAMVQNLADHSDRFARVLAMQSLLHQHALSFVSTVALPFVVATLQTWEACTATSTAMTTITATTTTVAAVTTSSDGTDTTAMASSELVQTALLVLRLVRFVLYPPQQPPQQHSTADGAVATRVLHAPPHTHAPLPALVQTALAALTQRVTRLEAVLRESYAGMLMMVLTVDCLCNVDAARYDASSGAATPLAAALDALLRRIADDTTPLRPHTRCTAAEGFAVCFLRLESPFRVDDNDTTARVHAMLAREEQALAADAEALTIVTELEASLHALQAVMMQLALCEMLSELHLGDHVSTDNDNNDDDQHRRRGDSSRDDRVATRRARRQQQQQQSSGLTLRSSHDAARRRHPAAYCCQLTGKLMREPVVLRSGHRYEYDALQRVIADVGHVDPLTGAVFDDDDVVVDAALQQEIARYRVRLAASGK